MWYWCLQRKKFDPCHDVPICRLDHNLTALVGDFGLTKQVNESDYYRIQDTTKLLPVRWMSTETLKFKMYTTKSDVVSVKTGGPQLKNSSTRITLNYCSIFKWSYGVVLWEIFSFGAQPYYGIQNAQIGEHVAAGKRLPRPSKASEEMWVNFCTSAIQFQQQNKYLFCHSNFSYNLMLECWNEELNQRPSFAEILPVLNKIAGTCSFWGHQGACLHVCTHMKPTLCHALCWNQISLIMWQDLEEKLWFWQFWLCWKVLQWFFLHFQMMLEIMLK